MMFRGCLLFERPFGVYLNRGDNKSRWPWRRQLSRARVSVYRKLGTAGVSPSRRHTHTVVRRRVFRDIRVLCLCARVYVLSDNEFTREITLHTRRAWRNRYERLVVVVVVVVTANANFSESFFYVRIGTRRSEHVFSVPEYRYGLLDGRKTPRRKRCLKTTASLARTENSVASEIERAARETVRFFIPNKHLSRSAEAIAPSHGEKRLETRVIRDRWTECSVTAKSTSFWRINGLTTVFSGDLFFHFRARRRLP